MLNDIIFVSRNKLNDYHKQNDVKLKSSKFTEPTRLQTNTGTTVYGSNLLPIDKPLKDKVKKSVSECHIRQTVQNTPRNDANKIYRMNSSTSLSSLSTSFTSFSLNDSLIVIIQKCIKRLDAIENEFSIEKLYSCLKHNLKQSGYAKYTLNLLEKFNKSTLTIKEFNTYFTITQKNTLNFNRTNNYHVPNRSSYTNNLIKSITQPIYNLFTSLDKLSAIFDFLDINFISTLEYTKTNFRYESLINDLSEKTYLLLNDRMNANVKLLSNETKLTSTKYEFFKNAEYVIRIIPDLIYKLRQLIKYFIKLNCLEQYFDDEIEKLFKLPSMYFNGYNNHQTTEKIPVLITEHVQKIQKKAKNPTQSFKKNESTNMFKKSMDDSFIIETDSSVISDEYVQSLDFKQQSLNLPVINLPQEFGSKLGKNQKLPKIKPANKNQNEKEYLTKKLEFLNSENLILNLLEYLNSIVINDKNCKTYEEKFKQTVELLKDTDAKLAHIHLTRQAMSEQDRRLKIKNELNAFSALFKGIMYDTAAMSDTHPADFNESTTKYDTTYFYRDLAKKILDKITNTIRILFDEYL
jgi:hypothetical protein